jgi:predicted permease
MLSLLSVEQFVQDLRLSGRLLVKSPGFATLTILILALGIGVNTAIFSVVHAVLLKPLPYFEPGRLVLLWEDASRIGFPRGTPAPANYADWKAQSRAFEQIEAISGRTMNLTGAGEPERINVDAVSAGLFPMLGIKPASGRLFRPEEDSPEALKVAVVSYALWRRRFGGDPRLIGESIRLNDEKYLIIGVLPPGFQFLRKNTEAWIPVAFSKQELANRDAHYLTVAARLKPGVTLQQAQADMDSVARRIEEKNPVSARQQRVVIVPLREQLAGEVKRTLIVLLVAVVCILLIACANVANLLLSRAVGRSQEMSLRAALGASRVRLLRQLLTEGLLLAGTGGLAGLLLAGLSLGILTRLVPAGMAASAPLELSAPVLLFSVFLSLVTAAVFGLAPALRASKLDLNQGLKQAGGTPGAGPADRRLRSVLVIAETALALALLVCAQLMIQTFLRLKAVDPGFHAENVVTARTPLPPRYADVSRRNALYREVLDRVRQIPGVVSAGYVSFLPLTAKFGTRGFQIEGVQGGPGRDALYRQVTPDYLRTMGIPIRQGRGIEEWDGPQAPKAAVISETMAQKFWPGENALGKRFKLGPPSAPWITIVGIAGDVKQMGLEAPTKAEIYVSSQQEVFFLFAPSDLAIRVSGRPLSLATLQKEIWAVDRELPVSAFQTMEQILDTETLQRRMQMSLLGTFAGLALLLAGLGIYGVMSYAVAQRTREIGIRMALGAQRRQVLGMVIGQGMVLALLGAGFGLAAAFASTRLLASLLFGTAANDPFAYISVSALLIAVSLAACFVPARRASRIDPIVALRYE